MNPALSLDELQSLVRQGVIQLPRPRKSKVGESKLSMTNWTPEQRRARRQGQYWRSHYNRLGRAEVERRLAKTRAQVHRMEQYLNSLDERQ